MKMTFLLAISPDDSPDNPGLKLASIHLDNVRLSGTDLHRGDLGPVKQEILDLFRIVSEHDDCARVNCAESIEELIRFLSSKEERNSEGRLVYARPHLGGEIEITAYSKCLLGLRIEGEFRYREEKVADILRDAATHSLEPLEVMASHRDGAHCGLADWYPEIEKGIQEALDSGMPFTTGWYGSKKEIASACITGDGRTISCEVSVSNDFDTNGLGEKIIPHTMDLELVRKAIYAAWDEAEEDQKNNETVEMFVVGEIGPDGKRKNWIETYLMDCSDFPEDCPLGTVTTSGVGKKKIGSPQR